jgi:hypothetical protein
MRTKRGVRVSSLIAFSALVVGASMAGGAGAASVNNDSIEGGFGDWLGENVGVQATSGPSGENPQGHESATTPGPDPVQFRLRVTCLAVQGNLAAYGTVVVKSTDPTNPPGTEYVEVARDGGLPDGGGNGSDLFVAPASTCTDFLEDAADAVPITHGNITIRDAQP